MTVARILDYAMPFTKEDRQCGMKKVAKMKARIKLAEMIEAYRRGDVIEWDAFNITIDVQELIKKQNN